MTAPTTRERIVETADQFFYHRGFEHTSFADIADAVGISRGNFYHHFKTKDQILGAVIERRIAGTRAMLDQWEEHGEDPVGRIKSFIQMLVANRADIKRYGCPVGTLCSELARLDHASSTDANKLFGLFRRWLAQQFAALGLQTDADSLAMHLLARSQGVATLASAFHDERFIHAEVESMRAWLEAQTVHAPRAGPRRLNTRAR